MDSVFTFTDELTAGLERGAAAHVDFTPAMAAISAVMRNAMRSRFELEEDPDGLPWLPSQRKLKEGGKTLQIRGERGGLLGNLLGNAGYDAFSSWIGTNLPYAGIHQLGGTIRPKVGGGKKALKTPFGPRASVNVPARPFAGFGSEEQEEIPEILGDYIASAFEGR